MKASEIYQAIDEMAPFSVHASYDNPGFLIGDQNAEVTKVLLALDITVPVVQEAAQLGAELIVSHHPVIFHPIRQLLAGSVCYELARSGISAICAHTNLDVAHEGVNDMLALTVGLSSPYEILFDSENLPLGRIGNLPASMELSFDVCPASEKSFKCGSCKICRCASPGLSCGRYRRCLRHL